MKKFAVIIAFAIISFRAAADEGMWLPLLLGQETYNDMVKKGCKLTKEQIFSLNKKSIKDAIVSLGGFCTAEIVSNKGLLFTNHHCGYDAIANLSTVDKNYLKDGYFVPNQESEMPAKGLFVNFLKDIIDVTDEVNKDVANLNGAERQKKLTEIFTAMSKKYSNADKFLTARVSTFFKGNQFLLFVYETYNDVRFVGCPSESFGKFGGDTDNWMWPRHTADFSVFRVYANANNEPAKYSPSNKPIVPKHFLPVSVAPKKEGDFNMILGYPGSTNRFEVSYGAKMSRDITDPAFVKMRAIRLTAMKREMDKDPATRLKLASEYANLANYWKFYDIESKQLRTRKVVERKAALEAIFLKWAKGKTKYENILNDYEKNYDEYLPYEKLKNYMQQGIAGSTALTISNQLNNIANLMADNKVEDAKKIIANIDKNRNDILEGIDLTADKAIFAEIAHAFNKDIVKAQQPANIFEKIASFGDITKVSTFEKYADGAYAKSLFLNKTLWAAFVASPTSEALAADPLVAHAKAFYENWNKNYIPKVNAFNLKNADLGRIWVAALKEMNPKKQYYPDANSTMRFTYGTVEAYVPRDGVKYDFVTTASGVLEKYIPNDEEFDVPNKALELMENKDYGQYEDKGRKDLVTCFLNTCDITGGNSGSAVLNGKGELIGLAFDGNSESMDQKLNFYQPLTRCINVDIRYVLWLIDKVGGAGYLINELQLMK